MKTVFIGAEPRTAELVTLAVQLRWPDVDPMVATSAAEGLEMVKRESFDVVVMHLDFDDMTLSNTIRELRRFTNVPLLVLGHEGDEMEVVTSLEAGADDYVRLPCDLTEIMVRIWALLRRVGLQAEPESDGRISSGRLLINPSTYEVLMDDRRVMLTNTEFRLLHLLMKNRATVMPHQTLGRALLGGYLNTDDGLVAKHVQKLRGKLGDRAREPVWIASIHGVGYRFIGPPLKMQ